MKNGLKLFCFFVLLTFVTAVEGAEKKVFLFAGQSNMAGADSLIAGTGAQNLVDAGLQTVADQNTQFAYKLGFDNDDTPDYGWGDIRGHLGVSYSQPGYYVMGPEVGFARTLYANGVNDVAIIGVSANIPIPPAGEEWPWTNENLSSGSPDFYSQWSSFVDARLAELTSDGDTYTVAGFVWWQGIDDAYNNTTQSEYAANLTTLISKLRSDYAMPETPFLLVRSDTDAAIAIDPIRDAQLAVADADPYADWVSCDDQTHVNTHHFTADSQLAVGQRLGDAYLDMETVPEPSSLALLTCGVVCWLRRKRK